LETSPQKQKEQRQKQLDVSFFWCLFPSCTFWIFCNFLLLLTFCQVFLPVKETAEIETGIAEKSSWDPAIKRQKLGLVWRYRKKISQIIKNYFYLPFFLLIILWCIHSIVYESCLKWTCSWGGLAASPASPDLGCSGGSASSLHENTRELIMLILTGQEVAQNECLTSAHSPALCPSYMER
jgi:hypothetical protein